MTIATLGVAFGVVFWGWGKLYALFDVAAKLGFPPAAGLMGGGWLIAGVVGGLIVRKFGAALVTETIAASVSALMPGNEWGSSVLVSGLLQGLGAELVLLVFLYKVFTPSVAMAAGALAGAFEAVYEWGAWYADWGFGHKLAHLGFFLVSGAVIAGIGGWFLTRALARAGALDAFPVGREAATRV
ncbi:MAG: ECF transporter S component [Aeromicrobium sp.]|uniref:ECF transporter S component n=1 Tax=Aeromicrobium sp. TaxID=1871063 RepID=UPI0039E6E3B5